ncbi:MAG: formate dehydrogenase accessory protein FdhE [Chloroflexota bacterium]|nr:formate dehydrogenase accessory protein FdhE [Chloroflexota bacterium]
MGREIKSKVLEKLKELEKTSLPRSIELYIRLTRLQLEARSTVRIEEAHLSRDAVSERVGLGVPSLSFDEMALDWVKVESLLRQALSIISQYSPSVDPQNNIPLRETVRSWYNSKSIPYNGMDRDILAVAVHTAVKPFLAEWSEVLLPMVSQEQWRRGYCPVCGGAPNFAYLDQEQGARWLCCPRCDAEWLFKRLECPFCANEEQKELGFFADEEGGYKVYFCESCKGYIKAVDLRKEDRNVLVPLEWVSTLDLDVQACERGYRAGVMVKQINIEGNI